MCIGRKIWAHYSVFQRVQYIISLANERSKMQTEVIKVPDSELVDIAFLAQDYVGSGKSISFV